MTGDRDERSHIGLGIAVAVAISMLDGFDSMSLSLAAPRLARALTIAPTGLGLLFSSQMAGMMLGAAGGGLIADRVGRLRSLLSFMALFAIAALGMPAMPDFALVVANRFVAGLGLGAAAPVAVALVASMHRSETSAFVISTIWAGLPAGGVLAALYNFLLTPHFGWQSIFVFGGILPLLLAIPAFAAFRGMAQRAAVHSRERLRQRMIGLNAKRLVLLGFAFLFGYSAMAIVVYWIPTVVSARGSSALLATLAFALVNMGSAVGSSALGHISDRVGIWRALPICWLFAGVALFALTSLSLGPVSFVIAATAAATFTAGAIGLLVVVASRVDPEHASGTIGLMVTIGRVGQVVALAASGKVAALLGLTGGVFLVAGASALAAALMSLAVSRFFGLNWRDAGIDEATQSGQFSAGG